MVAGRRQPPPAGPTSAAAAQIARRFLRRMGTGSLAGVVIAAGLSLPLAPRIAENLRLSVCDRTGENCRQPPPLMQCAPTGRDRAVAANSVAQREYVEAGEAVAVTQFVDGRARVSLALDPRELADGGDEAMDQVMGAVRRLAPTSIDASGITGARLVYEFRRYADADRWVQQRRAAATRVVDLSAGPGARGVRTGTVRIGRLLGFEADPARPSVAEVDVPLDGTPATVSLPLRGAETAHRTPVTTSSGPTGEPSALLRLGIAAGAVLVTEFDATGAPTTLELRGQAATSEELAAVDTAIPFAGDTAFGTRSAGQRDERRYVLDLSNAANRAAFDQLFEASGRRVRERVDSAPAFGRVDLRATRAWAELMGRIARDGVYIQARYRPGATAGESLLVAAHTRDLSLPSLPLRALSSCES